MRVVADPRFARWYAGQPPVVRAAVGSLLGFLAGATPEALSRPRAARIESSRHFPKLWELRRVERSGAR